METELWHGFGGYQNHKCRCEICRKANRDYQRKVRKNGGITKGDCNFDGCETKMLYANGLCIYHYQLMNHLIQRGIRTKKELVLGGYLNHT